MDRINIVSNFVSILDSWFKNCRYKCFWVILRQLKNYTQKLRGINSMRLIDPWSYYYLNNCIQPLNLDENIPKLSVLCDNDKSIYFLWRCNQLVVILKNPRGINPVSLSDPWHDSYLNNCIKPPNLDNNIPK